jgi:hypothetical protein
MSLHVQWISCDEEFEMGVWWLSIDLGRLDMKLRAEYVICLRRTPSDLVKEDVLEALGI